MSDIRHFASNPRTISKKEMARLTKDLADLGDLGGITHDLDTGELIGGNQRADVMGLITGDTAPIITERFDPPTAQGTVALGYIEWRGEKYAYRAVQGWTPEQRRRANIEANRAGGAWSPDILANEWNASKLIDIGFDEDWLRDQGRMYGAVLNMIESEKPQPVDVEPQVEADRFDEVRKKWDTADGQKWQVGRHTVYCGDSLTFDLSILDTPGIIIADPPYGVNIVAANVSVGGGEAYKIPFGGRKGLGSVGASKPFGSKAVRGSVGAAHVVEVGKYPVIIGDENTDTARDAARKYIDAYPDAIQVWWGANYYSDILSPSMCWLVWNKETTGNFADCELAWTNMDKAARLFTHRWNGMLRDSERERRWHPTQKPAALPAWILEEFTDPGAVLLDPFGGAGWALLAAEMTGRTAQVIEKSAEYVAVMLERYNILFPALGIKRLD